MRRSWTSSRGSRGPMAALAGASFCGAPGLDSSRRASAFRPSRWVPGRSTTVCSCTSPGSRRPASSAVQRGRTRTRSISITTGEPGSGAMRTGPNHSRRLQSTSLWLPSSTPPRRAASAASTRSRSRVRTIAELSTEWSAVTAVSSASPTTAARCTQRVAGRAACGVDEERGSSSTQSSSAWKVLIASAVGSTQNPNVAMRLASSRQERAEATAPSETSLAPAHREGVR